MGVLNYVVYFVMYKMIKRGFIAKIHGVFLFFASMKMKSHYFNSVLKINISIFFKQMNDCDRLMMTPPQGCTPLAENGEVTSSTA